MIGALVTDQATSFRDLIDSVARQLVSVSHDAGRSFISTPLMYPSGSSVVIRIEDAGRDFLVTDFGSGYEEASMLGAANIYARHAKGIAEHAGVGFDSHSFFLLRVSREQLAGAVAAVANCSQEAVNVAAYKIAEHKRKDASEVLYKRLVAVFAPPKVAKDVPIIGQSNTEWHVAAMVRGEHQTAIFEPVTAHHTSIFAASTKFHDIAAIEAAPARIAVVRKKADLKTYLAVLSQAATVIERDAPDNAYQSLAA